MAKETDRPDPDALLHSLNREQTAQGRGKLKVFLGMCPGVGKTYAMLEAAHRERQAGREVVVGYVESHGRKETDSLLVGLEVVPRHAMEYRGLAVAELDLDALLARRPQLALVDELAHTNVEGSRHPKRWQDVMELLDAGIDVFTTLNVQHVASRADTVRQITSVEIRETVPDRVLDGAILELVDLPPAELLQRLQEGKVYLPDRASAAARHFFQESHLAALRELALRLVADHVEVDIREYRAQRAASGPWKTGHCLLVGVGPSPSSEPLIRWTRRMADALRCRWLAVHVEPSRPLTVGAQVQLEKNLAAARELGAEVITTTDDDLVEGLLRVARQQNATQIVVGKTARLGWAHGWRGRQLLHRLTQASGDIDLHVVRAEKSGGGAAAGSRWNPGLASGLSQYVFAVLAIAATGFFNWGVMVLTGPRVPGLVFLLAVVLVALRVGRGPVLLAGALSALSWDFFFLPPQFTFLIQKLEDALLFALYFVVALVLGQLVARIRAQEQAERKREERAIALYEFIRAMAEAGTRDEIIWRLVAQIQRVFHAPAAVLLHKEGRLVSHPDSGLEISAKELGVAEWAFRSRQAAGRFTDNLPGAAAFHLPLVVEQKNLGVLVVQWPGETFALTQRELLESFAHQASLILERLDLRVAAEQTRLLGESEKFSRTLLNSISHELRTPLAASTSAASALAVVDEIPTEQRQQLVTEILDANRRLNRVVGNLLDVARLEAGKVRLHVDWHEMNDLVQTTLRELQWDAAAHPVRFEPAPVPMLVRCDFTLLQHALSNLLLNVATHTPRGTRVEIQAQLENGQLRLSVADNGPGIPEAWRARIFDKFFRAPQAAAGGSGLGLTIVKGFVEAHGGAISVASPPGGGTLFTICLPQKEKLPNLESHD